MRGQVIIASLLMLTVSLAGCITDSTVEQITEEITEILGCMDEGALNYDVSATNSSDLCLSEEQMLLAEEVFWSSWDSDAINNATEPVGYRLMLEETSEDENESRSLDIQEVFSSDYYDQKIEYRGLNPNTMLNKYGICGIGPGQGDVGSGDVGGVLFCHYSSQTVFDNRVQVGKFSDGEWDNYSMDTASTYDAFRNRLEHGPGIRSSFIPPIPRGEPDDPSNFARGTNSPQFDAMESCVILSIANLNNCLFPPISEIEFESIDYREVETRGSDRSQTIYYFAKDTSTGNEIEVMGEMTQDGFKITEYCNEIPNTNASIIDSYMGMPADIADGDDELSSGTENYNGSDPWTDPWGVSARIILLEIDGDEMRFEEYDYSEPVDYRSDNSTDTQLSNAEVAGLRAIPFYFEGIPDEDTNETQNKSTEGKKGLNAVNVKVVIAGPSGPYGMEGDLSDYRLVTSNCTLDNKTTGIDATTEADEEATSARSGNSTRDAASGLPTGKRVYGSDGNTCTNIDAYDLADIDGLLENGIIFVDADSSGTLSEGDRFEFSEDYTCDDCDEANMLRLYSISADEFSDGNINPSSEMSAVHEGAMNAIRNIRAVAPDDPPPLVRAVDHNTTRSNR